MLLFSAHSYTQYMKFVQIKELFSNPFRDIYLFLEFRTDVHLWTLTIKLA